jgi:zinc/manganese transport system ATP-binding protein
MTEPGGEPAGPAQRRPAAATGAAAAVLDHVNVRIGGRQILGDVSITVSAGEFIAVLGPNGAGKSTLMKTLLGLVAPAGGTVSVLGGTPQQTRSEIGYLPQRQSFDQSTRVRGIDLVTLGLDGSRWGVPISLTPRARARRRVERARVTEVIEMVGATAYAERALGELSGGEQQRLLIATALVRRPRLLILDEPLDSLDLPNQASVAALVGRIAYEQNVAVLLVAHDVNPLAGYLDRVVYLAGGRALAGSVKDVITAPTLSELYGTSIEVLTASDGRLVVVGQPDAPHHHGHRHGD